MGQKVLWAERDRGAVAEAREVNGGLRALFLPQHGRRPWVSRRLWFICPRTDASGRLYLPSGASPLRQMRLRRRTAGEWVYRLAAPRRCNRAARQVRPVRARRPAEKGGLKGATRNFP